MKVGWLFALLLVATPAGAADARYWAALRAVDARMATIAFRLATGNAGLCRDVQPFPGFQLHALDQYDVALRTDVRAAFGFARPVQVQTVVPGSPAVVAGIAADDALIAIGGERISDVPIAKVTSATRDAAEALLAKQPAHLPLPLTIERAGVRRDVLVRPSAGCRSAFEVLLDAPLKAASDGSTVQVGIGFFEQLDDSAVAAVVAHELSHTILRHRIRLKAARARWGLFAQFGRNAQLFRRTEAEADRLSVHLLRNAGYDPQAAVRFWRGKGKTIGGGIFGSPTHPSADARATAIEAEIAAMLSPGTSPSVLAARDKPLF
ncbi:MAG: peptidase family protein [Sphingomonas bacterium]|uniref:M48 family metalloprotease n=1 Tax=Sphingomonas bacterium TaxID=1895847 RepID=UPI00261157CB|nr:M48 family metalloprotease [Sphingomonas bacterium]MDB5696996.1 peptidase family protein [Sphingomonas bacterium]